MTDILKDEIIALTVEAVEKAYKMGLIAGAKAEREACARMAEAFHQHGYDFTGDLELHDAIRARGKHEARD